MKNPRIRPISIHGLRVEPDRQKTKYHYNQLSFQSTGSVWSPTSACYQFCRVICISIHGLRVEPDFCSPDNSSKKGNISIHGLRVEPDLRRHSLGRILVLFQSTGSVWSPTFLYNILYCIFLISIHGLRVEPDVVHLAIDREH